VEHHRESFGNPGARVRAVGTGNADRSSAGHVRRSRQAEQTMAAHALMAGRGAASLLERRRVQDDRSHVSVSRAGRAG